jgi:hypothetical protein
MVGHAAPVRAYTDERRPYMPKTWIRRALLLLAVLAVPVAAYAATTHDSNDCGCPIGCPLGGR